MALSDNGSVSPSDACAKHAWQQQDAVQVRLGILDAFLGRGGAEGRQIRTQQRQVEAARAVGGAQRRTSHVDVAAQDRTV